MSAAIRIIPTLSPATGAARPESTRAMLRLHLPAGTSFPAAANSPVADAAGAVANSVVVNSAAGNLAGEARVAAAGGNLAAVMQPAAWAHSMLFLEAMTRTTRSAAGR